MAGLVDVVTGLQNAVKAINTLNQTLSTVFPQAGATSATATTGAATLPAAPLGFIVTNLPNGTSVKVPYYNV
jgi:hypothetical protein